MTIHDHKGNPYDADLIEGPEHREALVRLMRAELDRDDARRRYQDAITTARAYGLPIERTSRMWMWVGVAPGEEIDFTKATYRIMPK